MCKQTPETSTFLKCLVKMPVNICNMEDNQVTNSVLGFVRGGSVVHGTGLYARGLSWAWDNPMHDLNEGLGFPMTLFLHPHGTWTLPPSTSFSMAAALGYERSCLRMRVLKAEGLLRQAGFLSECNILHSCFSFTLLKIGTGWWVAPECLHWVKTVGQLRIALCNHHVLEMACGLDWQQVRLCPVKFKQSSD